MAEVKRNIRNLPRRQRWIGGVIIGIFVIVIAVAVMTLVSRIGKVAVEVKVAPFDAVVYLNGARVKNDSLNYILPGTYTLTAEREYFETLTETVTVSENHKYILGKLMASDEAGEKIMEERLKDYLAVEGVMGRLAGEEGEEIKNRWPILKYLPINNSFYSISYAYNEAREPVITVKADIRYVDVAVQKMRTFKGVALTDYQINFDVRNDFRDFVQNGQTNAGDFVRVGFGAVMGGRSLGEGKMVGDYYVTTIFSDDYARDDSYGRFRVVVKKSGDGWELAARPWPILTKYNTDGVPVEVLEAANSL